MFTLSYLLAAVLGLGLLLIGWAVGKFISNKGSEKWKTKFTSLEKEHSAQAKKLKKELRAAEQHKEKAESWKQEYQLLTNQTKAQTQQAKEALQGLQIEQDSSIKEIESLKRELAGITTKLERSKVDQEKLQAKYKKEVLEFKDWANERKKLENQVKDLTKKYERQSEISKEYQTKYEKQSEQINKVRVLERELRMMKTKNKKHEQDIQYWEKKHYDTHHELASLKTKFDHLEKEYKEISELRKGDELLRSNLMQQIQEFKSKFVNINNKYSEMVNSMQN